MKAGFVHVPTQRNRREENAEIKKGNIPEKWKNNSNKRRQKDVDADWKVKNLYG